MRKKCFSRLSIILNSHKIHLHQLRYTSVRTIFNKVLALHNFIIVAYFQSVHDNNQEVNDLFFSTYFANNRRALIKQVN